MSEKRQRWPEPPPEVIEAGLRALAEAFMDQYPQYEVVPVMPGEKPRPGAHRLPAALPPKDKP